MKPFTRRKKLVLGAVAALCAWGASAAALDQWGHRATLQGPADCIVVLGSSVRPSGVAGFSLQARAERAAQLFHEGAAPFVLCTGGLGKVPPAESMAATRILLDKGVPPEAIVREEISTSTWENASEAAKVCEARGWKRVILVSNGYHLLRGSRNFRHFNLEASPIAAEDLVPQQRIRGSLREVVLVVRDALMGRL